MLSLICCSKSFLYLKWYRLNTVYLSNEYKAITMLISWSQFVVNIIFMLCFSITRNECAATQAYQLVKLMWII